MGKDVDDLKNTSEGGKNKSEFDNIVTKVSNLKNKLEDFHVAEESVQETKPTLRRRVQFLPSRHNLLHHLTSPVRLEKEGENGVGKKAQDAWDQGA